MISKMITITYKEALMVLTKGAEIMLFVKILKVNISRIAKLGILDKISIKR